MPYNIVYVPGDGIGPEVVAAAMRVVDATGLEVHWQEQPAGLACFEAIGDPLPLATLEAIRAADATLKGPTATASGIGFRSVNVALRQKLQLYANFRPARTLPGIPSRYDDVDLIVIRENTEGLYSGLEHTVVPGVVESLRVITAAASQRIARFAFETARRQGRKRVTCVHKANILKLSDGLFLESCREVAAEYPEIQSDDCIVDAAAMKLVIDPHQFDILVMENLFGDILSDLTSGLVGGLGVTPSANVGDEAAVFEAVHGTAPDIAGRGLANPTALIQIATGDVLTGDLGGQAGTDQFTDAVIAAMQG